MSKILLFLPILFLTISCNTTRQLNTAKGERLLVKNKIALTGTGNFSSKTELAYTLTPLFKQVPNRKNRLGFRYRLWYHYKFLGSTTKFGRWVNKHIAEPPAIYDPELAARTAKNFENYLQRRGYFDARCTTELDTSERFHAKVKYKIQTGELWRIDTLRFVSRDSAVQNVMLEVAPQSRLKTGGGLDGETFEAEKLRLTNELKNRGYAYFTPNYLIFNGDSTNKKSNITLEALPPSDSTFHQKYTLGKVDVFASLVPDYSAIRSDARISGVYFASVTPEFSVKPQRIFDALALRPGQLFRQDDVDQTYRRLNAFGTFRFISIKTAPDTLNPSILDATIALAPNKRFSFDWGVGSDYSSSIVSNQLLGATANIGFTNRNLRGGGEHLTTNLSGNLQFDLAQPGKPIASLETRLQSDYTLPRFNDYLGFWRTFGKAENAEGMKFYNRLKTDGRTRFSLSFSYLDLLEYYSLQVLHGSYGFDLPNRSKTSAWSFEHFGVDVLKPDLSRPGWDILGKNEFIRRSFGNQLFTGFVLRAANFNYIGSPNRFGEHWSVRFGGEVSGLEELAAHAVWTKVFGQEDPWKVGVLDFSKFIRADFDGSYTRQFSKSWTAIAHVGLGVAVPFGDTKEMPYVKQFFIGGPNSLRAWRLREIGPGGYFDKDLQPDNPPFYQSGNFRFEFNGELRFPIFWWFKGAVFVDGGNVWTLAADPSRPKAELNINSFNNVAIGTGVGLRVDVQYFVFRLDLGYKVRRPYSDPEHPGHFVYWPLSDVGKDPWNFNIAVGYPF